MSELKGYLILWALWTGGMFTSMFIDSYHVNHIWSAAIGILWVFPINAALAKFRKGA